MPKTGKKPNGKNKMRFYSISAINMGMSDSVLWFSFYERKRETAFFSLWFLLYVLQKPTFGF